MNHRPTPPLSEPAPLPLSSQPEHPIPYRSPDPTREVSVSLKIGRTSVMLYANRYRKPSHGTPGGSVQEYMGSFSVHATAIPPAFDALLRQATSGRPDRYRALVERLQERVLEPARLRAQARQREQQGNHLMGLLTFARQQLDAATEVPDAVSHLTLPSVREAVDLVVTGALRLQVPAVEAVPDAGMTPEEADISSTRDAALMEVSEDTTVESAEQRLQALLVTINDACAEVAAMMPEAAKRFRRGHPFEQETVNGVQQLWFRSSDAIAALNGRGPLKRPKVWDVLRSQVFPSAMAEAPAEAACESPELAPVEQTAGLPLELPAASPSATQ